MKKLFIAVMAFLALSACNSDKSDFLYRGLSTSLPLNVFIDSMAQRGFAVDSAAAPDSTGRVVVLKNPAEKYHVLLGQADGEIQAVQENWVSGCAGELGLVYQRQHAPDVAEVAR